MEISRNKQRYLLLMIAIICLISFLIMTWIVLNERTIFDSYILEHVSIGTSLLSVLQVISRLASTLVITTLTLCMMIILWLWKRDYGGILILLVFVGGGNLLNKLVKGLVERERPVVDGVVVEGYSFPSGHAMIGLILYGLIIYFLIRFLSHSLVKKIIVFVGILLLVVIGFSRIALGEHYAFDVLAGYCLGGFLLTIAITFHQAYWRWKQS